jgi:putative glutathione S-transferase
MNQTGQFPDEQSTEGEFERQGDAFRAWIRADGSTPFPPETGRYHLYVSLACPWAHRTLIVRQLKKLDYVIGVTVADPVRDERGWAFRDGPGHSHDPVNGFSFLREAYLATEPEFRGRWTVPVLWDKQTRRIVNNSEDDICRMFNDEFNNLGGSKAIDLFPAGRAPEQEALSREIYERVNNGVYRAGFATRQRAYERAARDVFAALDEFEKRHPGAFRRRLSRPLQVQHPPHRRLSKSPGLSAGSLPDTGHRADRQFRSHQAALLHDA